VADVVVVMTEVVVEEVLDVGITILDEVVLVVVGTEDVALVVVGKDAAEVVMVLVVGGAAVVVEGADGVVVVDEATVTASDVAGTLT